MKAHKTFDAKEIKKDFPLLKSRNKAGQSLVYLDNSATTQKPDCVINALTTFYHTINANVHRSFYELGTNATLAYEATRRSIAHFIHAKEAEEIAFTRGATEAINCLAEILGQRFIQPGDEILVSELEHHSNLIPWMMVAKKRQAHLRSIPIDNQGNLCLETLDYLLSGKTRILALTQVSNVLGTTPPLKDIIAKAHRNGTLVLIDAAQALAHMPIDVQDLDCDFMAGSGHKMYGPFGIGFFYGKRALLEQLPPYHGGGTMMEDVSLEGFTVAEVPKRFEAGTSPIADAIGLKAAIDYLSQFPWDQVMDYEEKVVKYAEQQLQAISGLKLIGQPKQKTAVVSFLIENVHPHDVATIVNNENVAIRAGHHCCQPLMKRLKCKGGVIRASFGLYNNFEDVDRLVAAVKKSLTVFKL